MNTKLPIGIDDFKSINKECYYADKTLLIKDLIDLPTGSVILYTRPRRFGKSLNLSMIKSFFDINDSSLSYFKDLNISKCGDEYLEKINTFPVISLSLNGIVGKSANEMMNQFIDIISNIYSSYKNQVFNSLDEFDQQKYLSYMNKTIEYNLYTNSLYDLCSFLFKYFNKKCLLLIDEYDTPLQNAFDEGFYDDIHLFFKTLFSKTLKSNPNIEIGVIFGVMEVSKGSLFSGLNNIIVNNILSINNEEYFGFNENDVLELLKLYNVSESIDTIREWYGGYLFGGSNIYNPWSILNYIKTRNINFYWTNTGSNSLISSLLEKDKNNFIEVLPTLLNKNFIIHNVDLSLSYTDIKTSKDAVISYLLSAGYLSIVERISIGVYSLKFPNEEIKQLFITEIKNRYINNNDNGYLPYYLRQAIESNNVTKIESIFENYFLNNFSYFDLSDEKNYQILVLSIISLLFEDYLVQSEVNTGLGRSDIMISSNDKKLGIVFEIKYSKTNLSKERLDNLSLKALKQIEEKNYIEKLELEHQEHIIIYGIGFQKKKVAITSKIIK